MTVLIIYTNSLNNPGQITAVERKYNDEVKYCESFDTWQELFVRLNDYFGSYAWVEVKK